MGSSSHDIDRLTAALADRYSVGTCVGAGATAVVYRAIDIRHDRVVALKVLRDEVAVSIEKDRFLREIRILSQLAHPNILPLFDSGDSDGFLYYAMPFVDESLRVRIAKEKFLPVTDALRFAGEIAEALDFAHARKIIHRDIKPANILIQGGHAVVADFGISRAIDDAAESTSQSFAIGTPAYMSPEQASGDSSVDGRSDIYALACTTYEMLAGSVPFTGPTAQAILARKTHEEMPSLRSVRPTLAAHLEAVLRQGLAVVPADRFPTAREFVSALGADATVVQAKRKRVLAFAVVLAMAVLLGLAAYLRPRVPGAATPIPTVAVAGFSNYTNDPARDDIGFMALDEITEGLQRLSSVNVVPMPSVVDASRVVGKLDTALKKLADFSRETGASAVLSGSYYLQGDSLIFRARVTEAPTQKLLAVIGPFSAPLAHPEMAVAQIRSRVMGYFATTSDERLAGKEEAKQPPPTYEAYRAFNAGMAAYSLSHYGDALASFNMAIAADSAFATPRLFASLCLSNLRRYAEADSVARTLVLMRDHLNPYYQDWLDYRLAYLAGDRRKALVHVRSLATRAPGTKATFNLALEAQENGYVDEALRTIRSLPPDRGSMREWVPYWDELGTALHLKADYSGEFEAGERARTMYPERQYAILPSVRATAALGRLDSLNALLDRAAELPDDIGGSTLGSLYRAAGEELRAHNNEAAAGAMFARAARWYTKRLESGSGSSADSLAAAATLYATSQFVAASSWLSANTHSTESIGLAGLIAARQNRTADARAAMARLDSDKRRYQRGAPRVASARIAALLRDSVAALAGVRAAFADGKEYGLWIHRTEEFASLRANPEFLALVRPRK
jgi:tRNA A-37 threonylcarbamoyl transferase component Bud32/TolB-like protein/tetratricopeptide (TPR) repeat protein